jgi:hypothetical protein
MDRRNFFKTVVGGITFTLAAKDIKFESKIPKSIPPASTELGKELVKDLVPEGFHKVIITDIVPKISQRTGKPYFDFELETKDGQMLHNYVSPEAPHQIRKIMDQTNIETVNDSLELTQFIGKEIDVKVEQVIFHDRNMNRVSVE